MAQERLNNSNDEATRRKNTSLRLPPDTLRALKIRAIEQDTSVQRIIEQLITDYLEGTTATTKGNLS